MASPLVVDSSRNHHHRTDSDLVPALRQDWALGSDQSLREALPSEVQKSGGEQVYDSLVVYMLGVVGIAVAEAESDNSNSALDPGSWAHTRQWVLGGVHPVDGIERCSLDLFGNSPVGRASAAARSIASSLPGRHFAAAPKDSGRPRI